MPKETFLHLPADKRRRVLDAAMQEFAAYAYKDASINRIVKAAGIPRGSFYQYFTDKSDLYHYLIDHLAQTKLGYVEQAQSAAPPVHFYACFLQSIAGALRWAQSDPLGFQVGLRFSLDTPQALREQLRREPSQSYYSTLLAIFTADQAQGLIKPSADGETALEMLTILGLSLQKRYIAEGCDLAADTPAIMAQYKRYLDTLMSGLAAEGSDHEQHTD